MLTVHTDTMFTVHIDTMLTVHPNTMFTVHTDTMFTAIPWVRLKLDCSDGHRVDTEAC